MEHQEPKESRMDILQTPITGIEIELNRVLYRKIRKMDEETVP
jgi:hypothetical protein